MKHIITALLLLFSVNLFAVNDGHCVFTKQEQEFFEYTENYPFSDKDFSSEQVESAKKKLELAKSGKEVPYYIPENTLNIIKGGELLAELEKSKRELDRVISKKYENINPEKNDYLYAHKAYCDFQRTHYVLDW